MFPCTKTAHFGYPLDSVGRNAGARGEINVIFGGPPRTVGKGTGSLRKENEAKFERVGRK